MSTPCLTRQSLLRDAAILLLLILLALIPRLVLLYLKGFEIFHADQAVMGIMANHILQGKPMVYFYGQGYMGSLEAFVAAPIFLVAGMSIFSLQLAPLAFYFLFLIVNYFLLKKVFGFEVSLFANLLLALSPPRLSRLSLIALGGYPETLFFGSLTLLGLMGAARSEKPAKVLFLTGLAAGIGYWVNNLILMYFISIGIFCLLRSKRWKSLGGFRKLLLLEYDRLPFILRFAGLAVRLWVLWFCIWQIVSFFNNGQPLSWQPVPFGGDSPLQGGLSPLSPLSSYLTGGNAFSLGKFALKLPSLPFEVKKIKKILYFLSGETVVLGLAAAGIRKGWEKIKTLLPLASGFLLGGSPAFLYSLLGGEGYRVIHGSGIIFAKDLPQKFHLSIWEWFFGNVCEIPIHFLSGKGGFQMLWAWIILALVFGLFIYWDCKHRKELKELFLMRPHDYSYSVFPLILVGVVLSISLFSTLAAGRYQIPAYFAVSLILAVALSGLRRRTGAFALLLLFLLLANNSYANFRFIQEMPQQEVIKRGHASILKLLDEKGVRGGYAHYITSYVLTFESREKIIIAPFRSPDRYPAYTQFVDGLDRVAYIFEKENPFVEAFQQTLDPHRIPYEKIRVGPFWVFIVDRRAGTEKAWV